IVAARNEEYRKQIFQYLLNHLRTCRPKDVAQHAEKILVAVNDENKGEFLEVLANRSPALRSSESSRVRRVIKEAEKR
ncbi:MAG: hypothetical protein LWX00_06925, partial [Spirochaetia bacterium]|nr:hypothetical protein [Spirochaetia bacterium]